jgi:hypothetical protein
MMFGQQCLFLAHPSHLLRFPHPLLLSQLELLLRTSKLRQQYVFDCTADGLSFSSGIFFLKL